MLKGDAGIRVWATCRGKVAFLSCHFVTEQAGGGFTINYYRMDSPLPISGGSPPHTHLLGSKCPPLEERCLSMSETGEKE